MYYRQLLSSNQANNFEFIRYSDSTRQSSLSFLSSRISNIDKYLHENDKIISLRNSESLFNDLMKYLPRIFTIKTNNGSCFFNIELLKNSSSVISIFLEENPNIMEYHIDVDDNDHILEKFEKLYQGDHVIFEENELPTSKKITGLLNIRYCPNYLKPESLKEPEPGDFNIGLESGVIIGKTKFNRFISQTINQTFKIITNQKEYKCNFFGVFSSKKIRSFIADNPTTYQFKFDFDDESDEFQLICNFFNFERVEITSDNIDFLKEMCDDLEIESISPQIDKYLQQYENLSKTIDDQQNIVDLIEDLFGWLYDIEKISVESVKEKILNSEWIKTEDQIFELAAFMIQVIDSSINLHPYLIDLLIQLDKESDKTNKLNLLLPCICENLFISFGSSFSNCSFIYMLHKKGFITKEQLIYKIKQSFGNKRQSKEEDNIQIWFLPELVELKITSNLNPLLEFKMKNIQRISVTEPNNTFINKDDFIYFYYPNKMEEFIKMRDSGEPEDELTKAIRKDDVDKVQSILSKREIDFSRYTIPFNIFDDLEENGRMKIIDYAAANGSLKCFKYMLLNQSKISELTFQYAISGYNTEIIKIVEQNLNSQNQSIEKYMHTSISKSESQLELTPILFSICKHQNNLFDYLFEQKYSKNINEDAKSLLKSSVLNGNAHSFIEIINKCEKSIDFQQLIDYASKKGFYQLSCLIYNFVNNPNDIIKFSSRSINEYMKIGSEKRVNLQFNNNFVYFGNLSIYKLGLKLDISSDSIKSALLTCLEREHKNIFDYVLDNYIKDDKSEQFVYSYEKVACKALECQDNYFFDHFIEYIKISNPDFFTKYTFQSLIETACQTNKIEKVKLVYKLMDENKSKINIASVFINLSRYENIKIEKDIFEVIIDKCCPEIRESILLSSLYLAINNKNKELVQFILNQNVLHEDALIVASENNDLDIVNVILDHDSDATFINRKSEEGTALYIAAKNNNLEIVKRLLSLPGIDPSLCGKRIDQTPLIASLNNLNVDIISSILGFYGEKIQSQTSQLNRMIELILEMLSSDSYRRNEEKNAKLLTILKKILEIKSIDLNCRGGEYTLLSYACEINEISLVQMLLETERVDINSYSTSNGSTPLMIAILNKNIEIAELLLKDKRTNINARNCKNQTALTIAVEQQLENIVSLIINNEKFNPKESSIDYAFYISNGSISNLLLSVKSVDINYQYPQNVPIHANDKNLSRYTFYNNTSSIFDTYTYETPLLRAVKAKDVEKVKLLIEQPSLNHVKSLMIGSIFESIKNDDIKIFNILLKTIDNNVNICNDCQTSLLIASICRSSKRICEEILKSEKFDTKQNNIIYAFTKCLQERTFSIKIANLLIDFDSKHEHLIDFNTQIPSGDTYLTLLKNNYQIDSKKIEFLFKHGADPNIPDKNGLYPLEIAIRNKNDNYVSLLLESGKVDLNQKIPVKINSFQEYQKSTKVKADEYTSYLHLSISRRQENENEIFKMLLDKETININIEDSKGNTPLMEACLCRNGYAIKQLFNFQELDYLHRNKQGQDALSIIDSDSNKPPQNKSEYKNALMSILRKNNKEKFSYGRFNFG